MVACEVRIRLPLEAQCIEGPCEVAHPPTCVSTTTLSVDSDIPVDVIGL